MLSIAAIIRRERHDPPLTGEERQRAMDFIVTQQSKNSIEIEKLPALIDIVRADRNGRSA